MSNNRKNSRKRPLIGRAVAAVAQSLFTRKDRLVDRPLKAVVRFGVSQFHRYTGYMKDEIIDADIGFTADELNQYQYGSKDKESKK